MTRKKKRTHVRIIQEEFDHFTRCGISRPLAVARLSHVYGTSPSAIEGYLTPHKRRKEEEKMRKYELQNS